MENQIMDKLIEENILKIETYVVWKNKRFALKDFIKETLKELEDYKSRIDKAIEYIEKNKQIGMFADLRKEGTHQYTIECDADDLLDILKGDKQ